MSADTKDLCKCLYTFRGNKRQLPSIVLFDNGMAGLRNTANAVKKHHAVNVAGVGKAPTIQQPLYVSLTDYETCLAMMVASQRGVPALPPLIHTASVRSVKGVEELVNTWSFSRVDDASERMNITKAPPSPDTISVLCNMSALLDGAGKGHAFTSKLNVASPVDAGVALASLIVARFSAKGATIWDLCTVTSHGAPHRGKWRWAGTTCAWAARVRPTTP